MTGHMVARFSCGSMCFVFPVFFILVVMMVFQYLGEVSRSVIPRTDHPPHLISDTDTDTDTSARFLSNLVANAECEVHTPSDYFSKQ